jgi:hypothetical protein
MCKILVRKPDRKIPLVRPRHRWEDEIKIDLTEIGLEGMKWIHLAQDGGWWQALVNTVKPLGPCSIDLVTESIRHLDRHRLQMHRDSLIEHLNHALISCNFILFQNAHAESIIYHIHSICTCIYTLHLVFIVYGSITASVSRQRCCTLVTAEEELTDSNENVADSNESMKQRVNC